MSRPAQREIKQKERERNRVVARHGAPLGVTLWLTESSSSIARVLARLTCACVPFFTSRVSIAAWPLGILSI